VAVPTTTTTSACSTKTVPGGVPTWAQW
jgi:hypothetical protein